MAQNSTETTVQGQKKRQKWRWIVGGSVLAVLLFVLLMPFMIWDGSEHRRIFVHVLDSKNGHPISGATVVLESPHDRSLADQYQKKLSEYQAGRMRLTTSDEQGLAMVYGEFAAGGTESLLLRTGNFRVEGILRVSHPNYRTYEDLLQNYLGDRTFSIGTKQFEIQVSLAQRAE